MIFRNHKMFLWLALMGLSQLNALKTAALLFLKLRRGQCVSLGSFSLIFMFIVPCEYFLSAGMWSFMMWPEVTGAIIKSCLHACKNNKEKKVRQSGFAGRHTLQELVTIFMPSFWYPASAVLMTAKIVFHTWPETAGWPILFRAFIVALDTLGFFTFITCAYWTFLSHILFMGRVCYTLESQKDILR